MKKYTSVPIYDKALWVENFKRLDAAVSEAKATPKSNGLGVFVPRRLPSVR